jgi:hypothetical protein
VGVNGNRFHASWKLDEKDKRKSIATVHDPYRTFVYNSNPPPHLNFWLDNIPLFNEPNAMELGREKNKIIHFYCQF